jgi:hypothetical protein
MAETAGPSSDGQRAAGTAVLKRQPAIPVSGGAQLTRSQPDQPFLSEPSQAFRPDM